MRALLAIGFFFTFATGSCAAESRATAGYDWNGLYLGAHAGKAWGETSNSWKNSSVSWQPDGDISYNDAMAGVHLGYNWQRERMVYGIEGDISRTSLKGDDSQVAGQVNALEMNYFSTIRARFGLTYGNSLVFATSGVALGEIEKKDITEGNSASNDLVGWTVGGGIEHTLVGGLRARVEYQYVDFGSVVSSLVYDHRADDLSIHSVRGGLSYGF